VEWDPRKLSSTSFPGRQLANTINRRAHFTCGAWNSDEVLAKVSEVAGIELIPAMDNEIAAVNIS
jgi:hypothetical protein